MFDTITGLPVHVLVNHAVVVLLPLMAVLTVIVAVREPLREKYSWWVVAGNAVVFGIVMVAKWSGEAFQRRLGGQFAIEHGQLGSALPWFQLFLVLASATVAVTRRNKALGPVAVVVVILAAAAAVFWTVRVGDSGARSVWGGR